MNYRIGAALLCFLALAAGVSAESVSAAGRQRVTKATPWNSIIMMDPANVDPSDLPLTQVSALHSTGRPQVVSEYRWRLTVDGAGVATPLSLTLKELGRFPQVKKRVILICPGFFYDYVEWEGVALDTLLQEAGAGEGFQKVTFTSVDGYSSTFSREEVSAHLLIVATRANGEALPLEHGFPARLVAEDVLGGRWVKYLTKIELK